MTKPLIIAHRGASALAPENTLAAFGKAIAAGAEGVEFDVQLARDGVPVIFHDFNLKRIAGIKDSISNLTSAELREIDAGTWFNRIYPRRSEQKFSAEKIPTLERLFDFLKDYRGILYVELKCEKNNFAPLVETVCQIILKSTFLPRIKLKSFNLEAIRQAKKAFPEIKTVALFQPTLPSIFNKQTQIIEKAAAHRADELSLHYSLATRRLMQKATERNFPVTVWTVDNPAWVKRALALRLDAIISNNPARLLARRKAMAEDNFIGIL